MRHADPAHFDQLQSAALDIIRKHKVWFVFAVDEEMGCRIAIACPDVIESELLSADALYRILLHNVIMQAIEELRESYEE